ncbi:glycosyltransferase [Polaribacter sp. Z014]|uniref:glycosyltransferase n=1 Tax=Polaribacter sp. Z014 TaxID=2927126 RepID=UPI00202299A8|nr:glycosyltransferase [Polaribacter sp. Z014]MCL7764204.1 glycosyltransferase [Polaribacter sp. Z014]
MGKVKKILLVSIPSIHFFRWIHQLEGDEFELYYYNIRNNKIEHVFPVNCKIVNSESLRPFKGEEFLKKKNDVLYQIVDNVFSFFWKSSFEKVLDAVKPDIVQAFELNTSAYPILSIMQRHKKIAFIYTIWGNDIYYFKNLKSHKFKIKAVFKRVNFLFSDCKRDYFLAKEEGFKGRYFGPFPGGGGFELKKVKENLFSEKENIILVKGYEHQFGRAINILKSLRSIIKDLKNYKIVIFSANKKVIEYCNSEGLFKDMKIEILSKNISHEEMSKLFIKSKIYIGNSISDGMPNTLLESICFGVFPIQSNPGGASAEVINDGVNGYLIEDPNNIRDISLKIKIAVTDLGLLKRAFDINMKNIRNEYEYNYIKEKVLKSYKNIF